MLDRDLLAERADVDELGALLGREADRALAHQERALADRADPHRADFRDAHAADYSPVLAQRLPPAALVSSYMCVLHLAAMRHGPRSRRHHGGHWRVFARVERFTEPAILLLLRERPAHGYDLLERLPELTGEQRVEMGNLYRLLRALEEEGLRRLGVGRDLAGPGEAPLRDHRARAARCSTSGSTRCAARRSAPNAFSNATRRGGEHAPRNHRYDHHGTGAGGSTSAARFRTVWTCSSGWRTTAATSSRSSRTSRT